MEGIFIHPGIIVLIVPRGTSWLCPLGCALCIEEPDFPGFDCCFPLWISSFIISPHVYLTFTVFGSPSSSILVQGYRCVLISFKIEFCSCFLLSFLLMVISQTGGKVHSLYHILKPEGSFLKSLLHTALVLTSLQSHI